MRAAIARARRWLARIIAGDGETWKPGNIGFPGSVGTLAYALRLGLPRHIPIGIDWEVYARQTSDLEPGNIRIVIEVPR